MKQADHREMFRKTSNCVYTSTVVVSPGPLSPTPRNSFPMKTPEDTEKDPYDDELAV
jgi:hypothetical protein